MSDFLLGFSTALFGLIIYSFIFKNEQILKKHKILLLLAVSALVLSLMLGWDDIISGFHGMGEHKDSIQNIRA